MYMYVHTFKCARNTVRCIHAQTCLQTCLATTLHTYVGVSNLLTWTQRNCASPISLDCTCTCRIAHGSTASTANILNLWAKCSWCIGGITIARQAWITAVNDWNNVETESLKSDGIGQSVSWVSYYIQQYTMCKWFANYLMGWQLVKLLKLMHVRRYQETFAYT